MAGTPNLKTYLSLQLLIVVIVCIIIINRYAHQYEDIYKRFIDSVVTNCTTHSTKYISTNLPYPCLQVHVFVWYSATNKSDTLSQLFENEEAFHKSTCSYHPTCPTGKDGSKRQIENYQKNYGVNGTIFQCKYQAAHNTRVVRRTENMGLFIHFFFWPGIIIFFSVCCIIYTITFCCLSLNNNGPEAGEVYVLQTENDNLYCPSNNQRGCSISCCKKQDFCYYRNDENILLGVCCRSCWKECLVARYVNLGIQSKSPMTVQNTQMWYRPSIETELLSFSQVTPLQMILDPSDVASSGLELGDHVMWHRPYAMWHHAIIAHIGNSFLRVIHWADDELFSVKIHEAIVNVGDCPFCQGDFYKVVYPEKITKRNPPDLVLARARSLVGILGYKFFSRNCENFATFCKTGVNLNHQYPWLIRRLSGLYETALYLNINVLAGATTFVKAIFSEAVEFAVDPDREIIGAAIVIILEAISFSVDIVMIYKTFDIGCRDCCSFWRCLDSSNDFKKMVWMRFFEAILGAGGMIGGSIGFEQLVRCKWSGLGHLLRVSVIGVCGGFVFGLIGKYFGNIIGCLTAKYLCYYRNLQNDT